MDIDSVGTDSDKPQSRDLRENNTRIKVYLNKDAICEVPKSDSAICWAGVGLQQNKTASSQEIAGN